MPGLFDTHAHLTDDQLAHQLPQVLERAAAAGIVGLLAVATNVETSRACVELAHAHAQVWASVGIHPNYTLEAQAGDWTEIERLASSPRVVALGETGLDKHWHDAPFDLQQDYFARHIQLSRRTQLPFIVHMRDCEPEMLNMLRGEFDSGGALRGVMHSFTGSAAAAAECVQWGLHISFAGMVTYKKSAELRAIAAQVPTNRLLVETDSPYLSPEPVRAKRPNEPANLVHTAQVVAAARRVALDELAALTTANARRLFLGEP